MGAGHSHHPSTPPVPARTRRIITAVIVPLALLTALGLVLLWPSTAPEVDTAGQPARRPGTVLTVRADAASVRLDTGPAAGETVAARIPRGPGAPHLRPGDRVVLVETNRPDGSGEPDGTGYAVLDHQRGRPLLVLVLAVALTVVGFARWRGLAALAGLAVSFAVLLLFVLPAISTGRPPLPVAVVGAAAIMFTVLYLTHGLSVRTSVAVLGTLASLVLTGVLGAVSIAATHLTGYGSEESRLLAGVLGHVDGRGLLLAGVIIGTLGVLDDVTVTQTAIVGELALADPGLSRRGLYRAATRIGRAHIASTVNTIVLAYAGASLPLLLLVAVGGQSIGTTLTSEFIAQEVLRGAVGTLGLVAAVPLTTGLAALVTAGAGPAPSAPAPGPSAPP
jgi:uncharacterized membrane protein